MDPGYIVVVVFGVLVVASALGVALVTIVLRGIRSEPKQWPVKPDPRAPRRGEITRSRSAAVGQAPFREGEHHEWTGQDLAGDDMRPVGTHDEKHVVPGQARWW